MHTVVEDCSKIILITVNHKKIIFLLRGLRVMDTFSKSDPMCVLYRKVRNIILLLLLMFVDEKMEFHTFLIQDENE